MKKALWFSAGIFFILLAYVGLIVPGIPWSTPAVVAAYCFANSSERMKNWIYNHRVFGPFLLNWKEKKIFPTRAKYLMILTMTFSLLITLLLSSFNFVLIALMFVFMSITAIATWRYPGSQEEFDRRTAKNEKIGWFK